MRARASTCVKGWGRRIWRTKRSSEGGQVEHVLARGESDSREYRNTISLSLSRAAPLSLRILLPEISSARDARFFYFLLVSYRTHRCCRYFGIAANAIVIAKFCTILSVSFRSPSDSDVERHTQTPAMLQRQL